LCKNNFTTEARIDNLLQTIFNLVSSLDSSGRKQSGLLSEVSANLSKVIAYPMPDLTIIAALNIENSICYVKINILY